MLWSGVHTEGCREREGQKTRSGARGRTDGAAVVAHPPVVHPMTGRVGAPPPAESRRPTTIRVGGALVQGSVAAEFLRWAHPPRASTAAARQTTGKPAAVRIPGAHGRHTLIRVVRADVAGARCPGRTVIILEAFVVRAMPHVVIDGAPTVVPVPTLLVARATAATHRDLHRFTERVALLGLGTPPPLEDLRVCSRVGGRAIDARRVQTRVDPGHGVDPGIHAHGVIPRVSGRARRCVPTAGEESRDREEDAAHPRIITGRAAGRPSKPAHSPASEQNIPSSVTASHCLPASEPVQKSDAQS